ncbi:MAG TPA: lysylphosphatidylglycerol synthase transmembrane domain-containing protein [Polyangiaceae bacterium]|jgi:uncharacterized membrane protein YbhN (UPF0104 family)|nr:lysylphosphatidylglycerol synthase transmembrane domain-containing protein [Polyangiaceae bacterium]
MTKARARIALQILGCVVAVGIVARLVAHADVASTWRAVTSAGPFVALALVPFAAGMTFDAWGMVVLLRGLGHRTSLAQMLPVRFASEALHMTLPAGFVASDTATALLLEKRCGVPMADGVVGSIARKWLVMRAHAAYIAVGAIAGFAALAELADALHAAALPWLVLGSAAVPFALSMAVGAGLLGGATFTRLHGALARVPSRRAAQWLSSRRQDAVATDGQVARLRAAGPATSAATLAFLACWCVEALESALLLRLVGAHVPLAAVFAFEGGLSMVRSAIVLAPAGLGVVDVGYATVLRALGVDPGTLAAFVLLRRAKEAAWAGAGYVLLGALRGAGRASQGRGSPAPRLQQPVPCCDPSA